jgi:hypothetical protein
MFPASPGSISAQGAAFGAIFLLCILCAPTLDRDSIAGSLRRSVDQRRAMSPGSTPFDCVAWDEQIYRERPPTSLTLAKFAQEGFQPIARVVFPESPLVCRGRSHSLEKRLRTSKIKSPAESERGAKLEEAAKQERARSSCSWLGKLRCTCKPPSPKRSPYLGFASTTRRARNHPRLGGLLAFD